MKATLTSRISRILALGALSLGLATDASAATLFGTLGYGGVDSSLVQLDPTTGSLLNTIGSVGYGVTGLAYDSTSGRLYGACREGYLLDVNMSTGAGTVIGSGFSFRPIAELAFGPGGQLYGWSEAFDVLVSIDKDTGVDSIIGENTLGTWSHGMAYDGSEMHFINGDVNHYSLDLATGTATYINTLVVPTGNGQAHHGSINPDSGYYYGVDTTGASRDITVADLATGGNITTLSAPDNIHTLEFVPEPGEYALFGGLALGLMVCVRRIRR